MKTHNTPPGIGQWLLVLFCFSVSGVGAAISIGLNWTFGLEFGGPFAAAIFVAMDCLKVSIPFVANSRGGWTIRHRATWAIAILISVISASSHLLKDQMATIRETRAAAVSAAGARTDSEKARADLAAIKETMSVAALTALADEARLKVADAEKAAKSAGVQCVQQKRCREANEARRTFLERLGQAQAKEEIQKQLATVSTAAAQPVKALGMAGSLAELTGGDEAKIANVISIGLSVLVLIALELAATFSGDAGLLLAQTVARHKAACQPKPAPISTTSAAEAPEQTGKLTKAQALLRLKTFIWHCPNERTDLSRRELALMFGVSRATFADWFGEWRERGDIAETKEGSKSILTAPRKSA